MRCPYCGATRSKVVDKRDKDEEGVTRRRRECLDCRKRFTTYERVEHVDLSVVKKDGSVEQYDRNKLLKSIRKAISLDTIGEEKVTEMVDQIEMRLLRMETTSISSKEIGNMVLEQLRETDPVGYMRFASVYKDFQSIEDFRDELEMLVE